VCVYVYIYMGVDRDSSVGIATGYGLDGPGIETRWPRFSAPVQTDPGAHPASCTMGTGSFPEVKSGRGVTLTPHPVLVAWSRKSRAIPLTPPPIGRTACTEPRCLYKVALLHASTKLVIIGYLYVFKSQSAKFAWQCCNFDMVGSKDTITR